MSFFKRWNAIHEAEARAKQAQPTQPREEYVACCGCGCLMRVATKVVEIGWNEKRHFCGRCAPKYDCIRGYEGGESHFFIRGLIEVTEDGRELAKLDWEKQLAEEKAVSAQLRAELVALRNQEVSR